MSASETALLEAGMGTTGGNTGGFNLDGTYDFRNGDSNVSGGSDSSFDSSGSGLGGSNTGNSNTGGSNTSGNFTTATDLGNGLYAIDNGDGSYSIITEDGVSMGSVGGGLEGLQDWEGNKVPSIGVPNLTTTNLGSGEIQKYFFPETAEEWERYNEMMNSLPSNTPGVGTSNTSMSNVPSANTLIVGTDSNGNPVTLADINSLFPDTSGTAGAATASLNTGVVSDAGDGLGSSVLPGSSVSTSGASNTGITTSLPSIFSSTSNPGYGPNPFSNAGNATVTTPDTSSSSSTLSGLTPAAANLNIPVVDLNTGNNSNALDAFLTLNDNFGTGGGSEYDFGGRGDAGFDNSFGGGFGGGGGGKGNMEMDYSYMAYARGGAAHTINGLSDLGSYSDGGRLLRGPGDGVSDSIPAVIGNKQPARLADGEFVIPARIVSELGNGSTEAGARKLYAMMDRIQATRKHSIGKGRVAKNTRADKHLPA